MLSKDGEEFGRNPPDTGEFRAVAKLNAHLTAEVKPDGGEDVRRGTQIDEVPARHLRKSVGPAVKLRIQADDAIRLRETEGL